MSDPPAPFPALASLGGDVVAEIVGASRGRRYRRGEVLFHAGDPGDTLHLVRRGRLMVYRAIGTGQRAILGFSRSGDVLGEGALFLDQPFGRRTATVEALEETETLVIDAGTFASLRAGHPQLDDVFLRLLATRMLSISQLLTEALLAPAEVRVRRRLAALAVQLAEDDGSPVVPITQDELAATAGTSRATVNRVVRELGRDGLVELRRRAIAVPDPDRLAAVDRLSGWD